MMGKIVSENQRFPLVCVVKVEVEDMPSWWWRQADRLWALLTLTFAYLLAGCGFPWLEFKEGDP